MMRLGSHASQQEQEYRGYRWLWAGPQNQYNVAVGGSVTDRIVVVQELPDYPRHPRPLLFAGHVPLQVEAPDNTTRILTTQETPSHPSSRFWSGRQGPNVAALPQVKSAILITQETPFHPGSVFNPGPIGAKIVLPPFTGKLLTTQETPFHPGSLFFAGRQGPNVAALPQVKSAILITQELPWHPSARFWSGVQGPNVRVPVRDTVLVYQEDVQYPRHPRPLFWAGLQQTGNVALTAQIEARIQIAQEQPWHPASFLLTAPPPVPMQTPQFRIVTVQELPWHPGSNFYAGHTPVDYEERQFFIII